MGDEVCCAQGVPGENVSSVASAARRKLDSLQSKTKVLIYMNECTRALRKGQRGYLVDPATGKLPAAIDVISLDGYCPSAPNGCTSAKQEADLMRHIYTNQLFPVLLPHQKVFIVPGLFGNGSNPTEPQDAQLVEKWNAYLSWMADEPRIIGVNPWHFDNWCPADDCLGTVDFPKLRQAITAFGRNLTAGERKLVKTDDIGAGCEPNPCKNGAECFVNTSARKLEPQNTAANTSLPVLRLSFAVNSRRQQKQRFLLLPFSDSSTPVAKPAASRLAAATKRASRLACCTPRRQVRA